MNLINYFIECKRGLDRSKKYGNDLSAEIEEFHAVLQKQDSKIRESVLAAIESDLQEQSEPKNIQNDILSGLKNKLPTRLRNRLSKMKSKILSSISKRNKTFVYPPQGRYYGSEYGFSDIAECAVKLKEMFPLPEIDS